MRLDLLNDGAKSDFHRGSHGGNLRPVAGARQGNLPKRHKVVDENAGETRGTVGAEVISIYVE